MVKNKILIVSLHSFLRKDAGVVDRAALEMR